MMSKRGWLALAAWWLVAGGWPAHAAESVWIEAEHMDGIRGYCWPMGRPEMKKTDGHWGLSGPGWAAEWNMGGRKRRPFHRHRRGRRPRRGYEEH